MKQLSLIIIQVILVKKSILTVEQYNNHSNITKNIILLFKRDDEIENISFKMLLLAVNKAGSVIKTKGEN